MAESTAPPNQPQFDALTSVLFPDELELLHELMSALADLEKAMKPEGDLTI
jgi:hypothetical protein